MIITMGTPANAGLEHCVGLDLGQVTQTSALALVETRDKGKTCDVRQLRRYPAGTSYPEIAASVDDLLSRPPVALGPLEGEYRRRPHLDVGITSVGLRVGKLFRTRAASMHYLIVSAGDASSRAGDGADRIPKREMIGALQAALQQRWLTVSAQLAEAATLLEELAGYTVRIRLGDEGDDWRREGSRADDLIFALAMAYWRAAYDRRGVFQCL